MMIRWSAVAACGVATLLAVGPARALTAQECSAKYQAAKTAGTLNGQKWSDFRKTQCAADATSAGAPAAAEPKAAEAKPAPKAEPKPAAAAAGNAVFPTTVDAKYAKETAARARMHTCADQWKANKVSNANGDLKWIQKGGGYWSECNKRLKG
jgi:hypothetical protein